MEDSIGNYDVGYTVEDIQRMASDILKHTSLRPSVGLICGTGLGGLVNVVQEAVSIPYKDIHGFPSCTVKGHSGRFVIGKLGGKSVLVMVGRFHHYEGYPLWKCAMPVRVMKAMGISTLIVTNAAGAMNPKYKIGDLMIIRDHIDLPGLVGVNVLRGHNDDRFGPRFLATNSIWDKDLRRGFLQTASDMGLMDEVHEGVYMYTCGPTFLSIMESKLIIMLGADATGMSTIPEAVVACHGGMKVLGFSLITDIETVDEAKKVELTHEEVLEAAAKRSVVLRDVVKRFVETL